MPLGENLTLLTAHARRLDYGRLRLWGSLAFIATSVAGGRLLVGRSEDLIFMLLLAGFAVVFAVTLLLPDTRPAARPAGRPPLRRLLGDRVFVTFLGAAMLVQSSHAVYYAFATLHWRAAGLGDDVIGLLWAEGVIAEVLLFAAAGAIVARLGAASLIALAGAAGLVRWGVTAETAALPALFTVQALHALTFGAAHIGAMTFLSRAVPAALSATAMAVYGAAVAGIGMGLSMLAAGPLYEHFGAGAFWATAAMAAAGGLLALALSACWDGGVVRAGAS
jgi:PPP family 3-phenylpropionic acid transporter